jgi:AraC-like DNA-binding protein
VLNGLTLKGALFFSAEFSAPWCFTSPPSRALVSALSPGAPHLVIYHFVVDGAAQAWLRNGTRVELGPGDIVVFPHGDSHDLGDKDGSPRIEVSTVLNRIANRDLSLARWGGGGNRTRFVCGFMACDPLLCGPILDGLPPMLKVNIRTDRSGHWPEDTILHLVDEAASERPGGEAMLSKLSEVLFVETLRRYVTGLPDQHEGWLAGVRDPIVGKSLALLHGSVGRPWTIAELAHDVGVSRSALVERFSRYLAEPPMAYLTGWRLRLAARALASTSKGIAEISASVGYESEAAFSRAFKRAFGMPPARYRRLQSEPAPTVELAAGER